MQRITLSDCLSFSRIIYGLWRYTDDPNASKKGPQINVKKSRW